MTAVTIAEAKIEDIPTIADMWQAIDKCATDKPFGGNTESSKDRAMGIIAHAIESPTACVLAARENQLVIGTVTGHIYQRPAVKLSSVGVIYSLWVTTQQRRQGVGQQLVDAIERHLIMMGAEAFQVGWDISNPWAGKWWQKQGFMPYETIASKTVNDSTSLQD